MLFILLVDSYLPDVIQMQNKKKKQKHLVHISYEISKGKTFAFHFC